MQSPAGSFRKLALERMRQAGFIQDIYPGSAYLPDAAIPATGIRLGFTETEYKKKFNKDIELPLVSVVTVVKDDLEGLQMTIESIQKQSYSNVEHIVIDGNSKNYEDILRMCQDRGLALGFSEQDFGIYDAMNKGIAYSKGDYICILNAGDTYAIDFIAEAVKLLAKPRKEADGELQLAYGGIKGVPTSDTWNMGILCHHLDINHQAFVVPADTYRAVGGYSTLHKVVSDIAWARSAFLTGVKPEFVGPDQLEFAPGGLSSSAKYRELIKRENAELTARVFGTISLGQSQEIYEFRFNPKLADAISLIVSTACTELRGSIACSLDYLLSSKKTAIKTELINDVFPGLFRLCESLEIPRSSIVFENSPNSFNLACNTLERFALAANERKGTPLLLHYLEVFNRASETFVYDFIWRNENEGKAINLILCDKRELEDVRFHPNVITLNWTAMHPLLREAVYSLIFKISWRCVVCHFALNSEKLLRRIHRFQWGQFRFIHMLHGIDVFLLRDKSKSSYKSLIVNHIATLSNHSFTTPSKFLKARAGLEGIPLSKINIIHNCANKIYWHNRKTAGFYQPGKSARPLKLLAVGRLIGWKNHALLIDAFSRCRAALNLDIKLTIVYGNDDTELGSISDQIDRYGLKESIELIRFINFSEQPEFFGLYDLFIMPSTYSKDSARKTETFGVATLEAIAAGLPVLVSNAGASPEIIENISSPHAQLFVHNDVESLSDQLTKMACSSEVFSDNEDLASEVLLRYSEKRQLDLFWEVVDLFPSSTINVLHVTADVSGGAGGAAWRCHRGLRRSGINSIVLCRKFATLPSDYVPTELLVWNDLPESRYNHKQPPVPFRLKAGSSIFSVSEDHLTNPQIKQLIHGFDLVHLNWVARFLSNDNIGCITQNKPTIYTVRDMHPLTGGCHYFHDCSKYQEDCNAPCPQMDQYHEKLPNEVMTRKFKDWNFSNLYFVGISEITTNAIRSSKIGSLARSVQTIHNGFADDYMEYFNKDVAKLSLELDADKKYILFMPSYSSTVKGADLAARALLSLYQSQKLAGYTVLVAGETDHHAIHLGGVPVQTLGYVKNKKKLNQLYSASEITLVPSLEETFSNTCAEAMLSGCPVVGYSAGAIPEMIIEGQTGYLASQFTHSSLADAILAALSNQWDRECIRKLLLERFSLARNSDAHITLYKSIMNDTMSPEYPSGADSLVSIQRLGAIASRRETLKVLTEETPLTHTNALISGCKRAAIWISANGCLCMSVTSYTVHHYIWRTKDKLDLASLKPVKSLALLNGTLAPRAYSGQILAPIFKPSAASQANDLYITLSREPRLNIRLKVNDQLVDSIDLRSCFHRIEETGTEYEIY